MSGDFDRNYFDRWLQVGQLQVSVSIKSRHYNLLPDGEEREKV